MEVGGGVMAGARLLVGGGYMLKLPSIDLAEVGAGGGSLCRLDPGGAPKVGPQSAGADPGPACYGRGGEEPTITDCNLVLGTLDPAGLVGGRLALDVNAATRAIERRLARPMGVSVQEAAFGMLRIAASTMMQAIRAVSVERGHDVRACAMMAFGGNGPMFAAAIARELGIARVIVPPMPGVFSAFGLLLADTEHHLSRSIRMRSDTGSVEALQAVLGALLSEGQQLLAADGFPSARRETRVTLMARYVGQSSEIAVPQLAGDARSMLAALPATFGAEHLRSYGFRAPEGEPIEITSLGVIARGVPEQPRLPTRIAPVPTSVPASRRAWFERHGWLDVPVLDRAGLSEAPQAGPLIVQEYDATCLVPPGCDASIDGFGNIRLTIGADADG